MRTEEENQIIKLIIKMALFQQKIFIRIPPEVRDKAFQEAILSGELRLEEIPTADEVKVILGHFGLYSTASIN